MECRSGSVGSEEDKSSALLVFYTGHTPINTLFLFDNDVAVMTALQKKVFMICTCVVVS